MKDEMRLLAADLWQNHRCKAVGLVLGLVIGTAVLIFGFWNTVFVLVCGLLGLLVGVRMDKGEELTKGLGDVFSERIRRW